MAKPVSAGAEENLVLLLALVPFVMDRGEVSVAEAATQFQRTEDEIRRAVELIACAGIPGDSGAYLHADLFDIDWEVFEAEDLIRFEQTIVIDQQPRLSSRELSALIAGLQYLAAHPSYRQRHDVENLLLKLSGAEPAARATPILIKSQPIDALNASIARAIDEGYQVRFGYVSTGGEAEIRTVDPIALEVVDDIWYLRGWCHTREALRVFRVERMSELEVLAEKAQAHPEMAPPDSWSLFQPSASDVSAVVEFDEPALAIIAGYLDRKKPPRREGSRLSAEISFAHEASLVRFVATHAGLVTVRGPESAKSAVKKFATDALKRHSG